MPFPQSFRHVVTDGHICINDGNPAESIYPYSWWITQEPTYSYPVGAAYLQYSEGSAPGYNYWTDGNSSHGLSEAFELSLIPFIAKQSVYDAAYAEFLNTPATLQEAKDRRYGDLIFQASAIATSTVSFNDGSGASLYSSNDMSYNELLTESLLFTELTAVPVGYFVLDTSIISHSFSLSNLQDIVELMQQLKYETRVVYSNHRLAISVLTTIEDVMAYDITTGWPTIPFSI